MSFKQLTKIDNNLQIDGVKHPKVIKLLLKIFNNVLHNPNVTKYQDLNKNRILKTVENKNLLSEILLSSGFSESNDGNRFLFDTQYLNLLKAVNNTLERFSSIHKNKNRFCICNKQLKKIQLQYVYNPSPESLFVCSGCNDEIINPVDIVYHCVDTKNLLHPAGYNLCANCFDGETFTYYDQSIFKPSNIRGTSQPELIWRSNSFYCVRTHSIVYCSHLKRICAVLKEYNTFITQYAKTKHNAHLCINCSFTELLNDFVHVLFEHNTSNDFENIYTILNTDCNNGLVCDPSSCVMMTRNYRNRLFTHENNDELYWTDNAMDIVKQQLIDKIHCYYIHSFDIGFKISKIDRHAFMKQNIETKSDHDENIPKIVQMHQYLKSKLQRIKNIKVLARLSNKHQRFILETDKNQNHNIYSFGYRFFYWDYYKNNFNTNDEVIESGVQHNTRSMVKTDDSPLTNWYIEPKYANLKQELSSNLVCSISKQQWIYALYKAKLYFDTFLVRSIRCFRTTSAKCYGFKNRDKMHINHLIVVLVYCNFDHLQFKFTQTFRKLKETETIESIKERHQNYHFLAKFLRECVECFGTEWRNPERKPSGTRSFVNVYHGVTNTFTFTSMTPYIHGPFSSTTDYAVAVNFCNLNKGMILQLKINKDSWIFHKTMDNAGRMITQPDGTISIKGVSMMAFFDCAWLSDYTNEQEIFTVGGLFPFIFEKIITSTGSNYEEYIKAIKMVTYCLWNGHSSGGTHILPQTAEEQQMVFRLLLHELKINYPDNPNFHEFKSCPEYVKHLLHYHCANMKYMSFHRGVLECKIHQRFFKDIKSKWIDISVITQIFPNVEVIYFNAYVAYKDSACTQLINKYTVAWYVDPDSLERKLTTCYPDDIGTNISFLKQSIIYTSVLSWLQKKKSKNLARIEIEINPTFGNEMSKHIAKYQSLFSKYSWDIYIRKYGTITDLIMCSRDSIHQFEKAGKQANAKNYQCNQPNYPRLLNSLNLTKCNKKIIQDY
eukprot:445869_1